jgi:biopolymer transport protein ExbB
MKWEGFNTMAGNPPLRSLVVGVLIGILAPAAQMGARGQSTSHADDAKKENRSGGPAAKTNLSVPEKTADASTPTSATKPSVDRSSIFRLVLHANPMLWPLAICSIVTLGYVMERFAALRRERVIPHEFADRFLERLSNGKLDRERALELCRAHDSPAARIFAIVVNSWGQPGMTIRQVVSHDAAGEVVELKRNLRVLSAMSTLGPLLGLLGTVVGIIQSFDALGGRLGPARGEALAHGISLALVATAFGLVIAIIAVTFYYFFLNRIDLLVRELDDRTRQVIELVSSESHRLAPSDRRHGPIGAVDAHRQESRAI